MTKSDTSISSRRYVVESDYNGAWLVIDTKEREPVQSWKTLSAASEHCKQLNEERP